MKVALGADHQGIDIKKALVEYLTSQGIEAKDFGPATKDSVDYPDYAEIVGKAVAAGQYDRGILICGTGAGMSIAANKVPGVRATRVTDSYSAKLTREHNDANVICLGAWLTGPQMAIDMVSQFLNTGYQGGRHQQRLDKVTALDKKRQASPAK